MSERIILFRARSRLIVAVGLMLAVLAAISAFVYELGDGDPSAALVGLYGLLAGSLGTALSNIVQAIASNPTDSGPAATP